MFYIPSFISRQDENAILAQIENTPKPKWTQLSNRRLINYGGVPHKNGMIAEELPNWLKDKVAAVNNTGSYSHQVREHLDIDSKTIAYDCVFLLLLRLLKVFLVK